MNPAQLAAWFQANRKPVLVAAGVGAAGLGLMQARKRAATAGGEPAPGPLTPTMSSAGTAFAAAPAIAGTIPYGKAYDTSVLDAHNDLQAQILQLMDEKEKPPVPVPVQDGFYREAGGATIWKVDGGVRTPLSYKQWEDFSKTGASWTPVLKDKLLAQTKPAGT